MSDYQQLLRRAGKLTADRAVALGYIDPPSSSGDRVEANDSSRDATSPAKVDAMRPQQRLAPLVRIPADRDIRLPHPIPYQGSKRALAPKIAPHVPAKIERWFEPFAGSAAMTIWAASVDAAEQFVIGDSLRPMTALWAAIIDRPLEVTERYEAVWRGQREDDPHYFNRIRDRFNAGQDPVELLYLICRCVKNAVRFNAEGRFTQSVDKRRLGMRPDKMRESVLAVSTLLRGRTEVRDGDWLDTTRDASEQDFIYMDPPYLGTTIGRDKRYAEQLQSERLISGLGLLISRRVRFALSYDGMTGGREYGPPLPAGLGLTRLLLHAGRSSQSTLIGRSEETVESLYLSPGLTPGNSPKGQAPASQEVFSFASAS